VADFPLRLQAKSDGFAIDLLLKSQKSYVLQGDQGLSQKSPEPGNASYYYSYPRLETEGAVTVAGQQVFSGRYKLDGQGMEHQRFVG